MFWLLVLKVTLDAFLPSSAWPFLTRPSQSKWSTCSQCEKVSLKSLGALLIWVHSDPTDRFCSNVVFMLPLFRLSLSTKHILMTQVQRAIQGFVDIVIMKNAALIMSCNHLAQPTSNLFLSDHSPRPRHAVRFPGDDVFFYGCSSELEELGSRTHSCLRPLFRLLLAIRSLLRITSTRHGQTHTHTWWWAFVHKTKH